MPAKKPRPFNAQAFLDSAGIAREIVQYARGARIFSQGDLCKSVLYVQTGAVKLSVQSKTGHEAVVAVLGPGDFFGEGGLAGQRVRMGSATALTPSTILQIEQDEMVRLLHEQHTLSDCFISHVLAGNVRTEQDLIDQLFTTTETRLARTLLLLARYGQEGESQMVLPNLSQDTLAAMVGTTRSRVNLFMDKFQKLGFIEYNGTLTINNSLLTVVLHD